MFLIHLWIYQFLLVLYLLLCLLIQMMFSQLYKSMYLLRLISQFLLSSFYQFQHIVRLLFSSYQLPSHLIFVMLFLCSFPVPKSLAETFTIPFASISNVTSICGIPLGAGGIPIKSNLPKDLLSVAISLSPCNTWIVTAC